jgi:hypothetical protein
MDMMCRPRCDLSGISNGGIELIDLGCLQLLERPSREHRLDVRPQQLPVTFKRALRDRLPSAARRTSLQPLIDPLPNRDLGRRDVIAVVGAFEQLPQFLARLGLRAVEGLLEPLVIDAVAEPEGVRSARLDRAFT